MTERTAPLPGDSDDTSTPTMNHHTAITPNAPSMTEAARLREIGFYVVPACWPDASGRCACPGRHTDEHAIGKAPWLSGCQDLRLEEPGIRALWEAHPDANVAILLGPSNLVDIAPDSEKWLADFKARGLPRTLSYQSGGGAGHAHYLYRRPDACPPHRICRPGEYDILSSGVAIAPPSRHRSGGTYTWLVAPGEIREIPVAPLWAVELLREKAEARTRTAVAVAPVVPLADGSPPPVELTEIGLRRWGGELVDQKDDESTDRSESLFTLGRALANAGADRNTVASALAERDASLGWDKYTGRSDAAIRYREIADKAVDGVESRLPAGVSVRAEGDFVDSVDSVPGRADEPWAEPVPFREAALPPFPTDVLPTWLRAWVEAETTTTQTPSELAGMLGLAVLAAACGGRLEVRASDDWTEPVNLYAIASLPPGNRKSAVFREAPDPLQRWEAEQGRRLKPVIAEAKARHKLLQEQLKTAEREAAEAGDDQQEAALGRVTELTRQIEELQEKEPRPPRLLVDDVTAERLAELLHQHGGRLALMSAEGDIFEQMRGRYSTGPNFTVYLKAHAGDTLRVDRKNGTTLHIRRPALTIALTVQPTVIRGLASTREFAGLGLLARLLFALPESPVGYRAAAPPAMPGEVRAAYRAHITALLDIEDPGVRADGEPQAHVLVFSAEARDALQALQEATEVRLQEFGDLGPIADWGSKLAGAVVRIAGLLHMAEHAKQQEPKPWMTPIAGETLAAAARLGEYLVAHAKAAFAEMEADPLAGPAQYVLRWLFDRGCEEFSLRDAQAALKRFKKADELRAPIDRLVEHGYLRPAPREERTGPGRPPSQRYEVNPIWLEQNRQNPHIRVVRTAGGPCKAPKQCRRASRSTARTIAIRLRHGADQPRRTGKRAGRRTAAEPTQAARTRGSARAIERSADVENG